MMDEQEATSDVGVLEEAAIVASLDSFVAKEGIDFDAESVDVNDLLRFVCEDEDFDGG